MRRKRSSHLLLMLKGVNILTMGITLMTGVRLFFLIFQYNILLVLENEALFKQVLGLGGVMCCSLLITMSVENVIREKRSYE